MKLLKDLIKIPDDISAFNESQGTRHFTSEKKTSSITKKHKQLNENELTSGYGLIIEIFGQGEHRNDIYEPIQDAQVFYGNYKEFQEAVLEKFQECLEYLEDDDAITDVEYRNLKDHESYEFFDEEYCWVVDKFRS